MGRVMYGSDRAAGALGGAEAGAGGEGTGSLFPKKGGHRAGG